MKRAEYEGLILRDKMKLTKSKLKETIRKVLRERIQLDTTEYQFSHGKKPRGWGRWMFAKDKKIDIRRAKENKDYVIIDDNLQKAAQKAGKILKTNIVYVMP